jgi:hypothetical protein
MAEWGRRHYSMRGLQGGRLLLRLHLADCELRSKFRHRVFGARGKK